jgi:hypothetical protein
MHHLVLAGACNEAGPCLGHLAVQELQARAGFLQQLAGYALRSRMRGRFPGELEGIGCGRWVLRRGRSHATDY